MALYDRIGRTYDTTRRADPDIVEHLARLLRLAPGAPYLDVGCGTGNYTIALANRGARMFGADISWTMLDAARRKSARVNWCLADSAALPFPERTFAGASGIFTVHHMHDPFGAFAEIFRVIASGNFVIMGADHEQVNRYWLKEYFPRGIAKAAAHGPSVDEVIANLRAAGFRGIETDRWEVSETLQDWFLYAGKHRPEIYFDPAVRAGISCFAQGLISAEETSVGLARLEADLKSGRLREVVDKYRHDLGDYIFVRASKD